MKIFREFNRRKGGGRKRTFGLECARLGPMKPPCPPGGVPLAPVSPGPAERGTLGQAATYGLPSVPRRTGGQASGVLVRRPTAFTATRHRPAPAGRAVGLPSLDSPPPVPTWPSGHCQASTAPEPSTARAPPPRPREASGGAAHRPGHAESPAAPYSAATPPRVGLRVRRPPRALRGAWGP